MVTHLAWKSSFRGFGRQDVLSIVNRHLILRRVFQDKSTPARPAANLHVNV